MKLLTIAVPSYNVEKTLRETLLSFCIDEIMEFLDVVIVNDGSGDSTAAVADEFVMKNPSVFRLITKENGGHGSAVNAGIDAARGKYFKVVDGDDRLEREGLIALIGKLLKTDSDLVAAPYKKVPEGGGESVPMPFEDVEAGRVYQFDELPISGKLYFGIHSITIKTEILKNNIIRLQEHTFYVDVEYGLLPVPFIKTVEFIEKYVYLYTVGSAGQSINTENFVKRYDDHYRVVKRLCIFASSCSCTQAQHEYIMTVLRKLCFTNYMLSAFYDSDVKRGKRRSKEFDGWLLKNSPELYENLGNSRYIRFLRMFHFRILPRGSALKNSVRGVYSALKPLFRKKRKFTY